MEKHGGGGGGINSTEMLLCVRHCGRPFHTPTPDSSPGRVNTRGNCALAKLIDFSKSQSEGMQKPGMTPNVDDERIMKQNQTRNLHFIVTRACRLYALQE